MDEENDLDQLIASAARFLIDGGENEAANVLLSCSIEGKEFGNSHYSGLLRYWSVHLKLRGPRMAYSILSDVDHPISSAVSQALSAVLPHDEVLDSLDVRVELISIDPGWRSELIEIARGLAVDNQGPSGSPARTWQGLRFRSMSEVKVAEALERAGVMFFPLCMGRMNHDEGRVNREPDFLICHEGRWGIMEVDGEPFHPPERTVDDHRRDRLFKNHGVSIVEHYDATECYQNSDRVVSSFLKLLMKV